MSEATPLYAATGDAQHRSVEQMLEDALAQLRGAGHERPDYGLLVLGYVAGDQLAVRIHSAGTDKLRALGLLELGKIELMLDEEGD